MRYSAVPLAPGDAGSAQTLQAMGVEIVHGAQDPRTRALALEITAAVPERDVAGMIAAVYAWVQANMKYQWDPWDVELLTTPGRLVDMAGTPQGAGDCDDFVILTSALLRSLGLPTMLKGISGDPRSEGLYDHVYLLAGDPVTGAWIPVDPIQRGRGIGWEPPQFARWIVWDPAAERAAEQGSGTHHEAPVAGFAGTPRLGDRTGEPLERVLSHAESVDPPWRCAADRAAMLRQAEDLLAQFPTLDEGGAIDLACRMLTGDTYNAEHQLAQLEADRTRHLAVLAALVHAAPAWDRAAAHDQAELDAIIAEAVTYFAPLGASLVPLLEHTEAVVGRLKDRAERLATINKVATVTATVLSVVGKFTAGIGDVLALAVTLANLAYQLRQQAGMLTGATAGTARELSSAITGVAQAADWTSGIISEADGRWWQLDQLRDAVAVTADPAAPPELVAQAGGIEEPPPPAPTRWPWVLAAVGVVGVTILAAVLGRPRRKRRRAA